MKDKIKSILREGTLKNSLGVTITRPDQVLIVMRGIPGSGKSTKAKELAGTDGIIHSTDDVIEAQGDYREFFEKMITTKDFSPLSKAHSTNLTNLTNSLKSGASPVILDNTNIKQNESKVAVKSALDLGLDDKNIQFVDIGTGGLSAQELADRNTHGVPLEKIESMIASHAGQGPLSVASVMGSKDMYSNKSKKFASLVLDDKSKSKLLNEVSHYIPEGWKVIAHHMTINFGKGLPEDLKNDLGEKKTIRATQIGISDMAIAVKVGGYHSDNNIAHVTIAINPNGGKPVMSNDVKDWQPLTSEIVLTGVVTEETLK